MFRMKSNVSMNRTAYEKGVAVDKGDKNFEALLSGGHLEEIAEAAPAKEEKAPPKEEKANGKSKRE